MRILKTYIYIIIFCGLFGCTKSGAQKSEIKPGIWQIEELDSLAKGKKIAVVANQSSVISQVHLIDTLLSRGIDINCILSPEHGFKGIYEAGEIIEKEEYDNVSIPLIPMYGKSKEARQDIMERIELIVFDLQDVGVRFFTYISTLHYIMQACAENNVQLVVLDRPNPNAHYIDGPVLREEYKSFVGMHPVPVVYGMTIGEYAKMINGEGWLKGSISCNLTVIPIENYTHNSKYILPEKPSPNLPDMQSVYLYPSLCFFEGTIMSEGRGTDLPFQVFGHPNYPDTSFFFIPESIQGVSNYPKFEGQKCYGVKLDTADIYNYTYNNGLNLNYLFDAYQKMNIGEVFFTDYFNLLVGNSNLKQQIIEGLSPDSIKMSWKTELESFNKIRKKYLIYP